VVQTPGLPDRLPISAIAFVCLALSAGCAERLVLPPVGSTLPYAARLELAPSVAAAHVQYVDGCGHIQDIAVGSMLKETLSEAAYRTFQSVSLGTAGGKDPSTEVAVLVDLVQYKLGLKQDAFYDQVPADIQFKGRVRFQDSSGNLLQEAVIQIRRHEHLRPEQTPKNCGYIINPFLQDAVVEFASTFMVEARAAFGIGDQTASTLFIKGAGGALPFPPETKLGQGGAEQTLVGTQSILSPL